MFNPETSSLSVGSVGTAVQRVKRGIKLLEKKIPNWRTVLRRHEDQFDFADGAHCVLGTLEHYSKRMKQLPLTEREKFRDTFDRAYTRLGIDNPAAYGFDSAESEGVSPQLLDTLWRAEFEKSPEA